MSAQYLAVKQYLEQLRERCDELSQEELIEVVSRIGLEKSPDNRGVFLEQVSSVVSNLELPQALSEEELELLRDIDTLQESVAERIEGVFEGRYQDVDWSGYYDYYGGRSYEPGLEVLTEEQVEGFESVIERTHAFFKSKKFSLAKEAYVRLLRFFEKDHSSKYEDVLFKLKACYYRCIYELYEDKYQSIAMLLEIMVSEKPPAWIRKADEEPLLRDIDKAHSSRMNLAKFVRSWKAALRKLLKRGDYALTLYLEALLIADGMKAVKDYAIGHRKQALASLFWVEAEKATKNWKRVKTACVKSLEYLPRSYRSEGNQANAATTAYVDSERLAVARILLEAGKALKEKETTLTGLREIFYEEQTDTAFIAVLDYAKTAKKLKPELQRLSKDLKDTLYSTSYHTQVELIKGNWKVLEKNHLFS